MDRLEKHDAKVIKKILKEAHRINHPKKHTIHPVSIVVGLVMMIIVLLAATAHSSEVPITQSEVNAYADAIYKAEGGEKASKPYGILSVPCDSEHECRRICINTIRNNVKRYIDYGHKDYDTYLEFLASRYAPVGATNDPSNLNRHWIKNVSYFLGGDR